MRIFQSILCWEYLVEPELLDILKTLLLRDIVHNNYRMCAFIVCARDCSKSLLPSCVPDLELYNISIDCDGPTINADILEPEVHSDGGEVALLKRVVCEPTEQGGLADRTVAHDDYFEEIIVFSNHGFYSSLLIDI